MSDDIKRISIKEFRELGFIQEINRRLLHPCGLALEVVMEENGDCELGGVWDYRDDPEGMAYAEGMIDDAKVKSVDKLFYSKMEFRAEELGFFIQQPEE